MIENKKQNTYNYIGDNPGLFERLEKKTNDTTGDKDNDDL
jgi:hypothetical protein